ncbi:MarR family winged helix-turn-helix transcriptional regulator [Kribbella sp. CA-293567]|uniref:MarR family winged helix-turn-helix transcriptional regulator n=1 Tax=Kribbella sp. CA-293567 TaxID=3002436 RepID=UPI0022DDA0EE|nr:MarR family transcriptional regulator [Kribbella sp. CA-293567]WBQ04965.1 MarR family transcriptional regulator [Kribbella sp. CA-293567]
MEQQTLQLLVGMHRVVRHLRRTGASSALHPTQFIALLLIGDEQPIRIGEIANRVPCSQPTATTTVAGLEAAGLARRQPDLLDGRATAVVLTPQGDEVVKEVGRQAVDDLSKLLVRLSDEDRALVLSAGAVLSRMADDL